MRVVHLKGGLGNQMFQYSFGEALRARGHSVYYAGGGHILQDAFDITVPKIWPEYIVTRLLHIIALAIPSVCLLERELFTVNKHATDVLQRRVVFIDGYFQNHRYFETLFDAKDVFTFTKLNTTDSKNKAILRAIQESQDPVAVHIRRGDYLTKDNESVFDNLCKTSYYKEAIQAIRNTCATPTFFVFSDDIEWAKEYLEPLTAGSTVHFVQGNTGTDSFRDLQLMSECAHAVIANSSFSFWGAYLAYSLKQMVVCPRYYDVQKRWDGKNFYPEQWLKL